VMMMVGGAGAGAGAGVGFVAEPDGFSTSALLASRPGLDLHLQVQPNEAG